MNNHCGNSDQGLDEIDVSPALSAAGKRREDLASKVSGLTQLLLGCPSVSRLDGQEPDSFTPQFWSQICLLFLTVTTKHFLLGW